jgi:predicted phosphodiesterase
MEKTYRSIFISDVHLGTKECQADRLNNFLKHNTCESLYLVGDIIDGWKVQQNRLRWKQSHTNVVRRILGHAKRGTRVIYIAGNHDEFLRPMIPYGFSFGLIEIKNQTEHIGADGKHYLVVHGDMFDGLAYVKAIESKGFDLRNKTALLVGAGGAGSAIAHSLVLAGVKELAIQDENTERRDSLIHRLNSLKHGRVYVGSSNLIGFDVAINATPVGMRETDPSPFDLDNITPNMFIGCVITAPAIPPLIAVARAKGCNTTTGEDMFLQVRELMVQFLLEV